jgi:hypothetical protein
MWRSMRCMTQVLENIRLDRKQLAADKYTSLYHKEPILGVEHCRVPHCARLLPYSQTLN